MSARRISAAGLVALALSGCTAVGPEYERPQLGMPESYSDPGTPGAISDRWWELFGDRQLDQLVEEALAANQDLAVAAARVDEARAFAGIARADRFPSADAAAGTSRTKLSEDTSGQPPGSDLEFDRSSATVGFSFELDFWGRYARAHEAARAELLASEEARLNVRLGVLAGVATAWYDLAALDRGLALARSTVASRADAVRLQRLRLEAGTISELDLAQAEAELASAEAAVPQLERALRQTVNRLGVLLGRPGATLSATGGLEPSGAQTKLPAIPVGLPSELLARRPDIVAAEQALVAANARIGVARAAYFPSITLTGYTGSESSELSDLLGAGTSLWQLAAGLFQPIFNTGKIRRGVEVTEARREQALALYRKSVQSAFAEVEDALVARRTGAEERAAFGRQVEALARASRLATVRYEAGDSSYLEVLDAERNLFRAQLQLVDAERLEAAAAVALFKALGGGWTPPAEPGVAAAD